jgi:CBS domain-containing protein
MDNPIRRPEEILAFRQLREVLASKPRTLFSVAPSDSVLSALQIMSDNDLGCVVVLERGELVGIVSERDCARRVVLERRQPETTPISDIMVRNVITAGLLHSFADCLRLMHQHGIRHLPIMDNGKPVTVVSIRDLLSEAVAHHARIIDELERERMTIFTSMA